MSEPLLDPPAVARPRLDSIDIVRGAVMVLMALDHARDYFGPAPFLPEDLTRTTPLLFLTRWVTHYCAPVFVFLTGVGAYLYGTRPGRTRSQVAGFLLSRGVWLIVLEFTVVHCAWWCSPTGGISYGTAYAQVIWAIGVSLVCLAALIYLPRPLLWIVALGMIVGHNLLDGLPFERTIESLGWQDPRTWIQELWSVLHVRWAPIRVADGHTVIVIYPLIPWIGVMALGYAIGPWFSLMDGARRGRLIGCGLGAMALFVALRTLGQYGDPRPWSTQDSWILSTLSFLNCEKYPPSLCFLLMTLGPALVALALFERARGVVTRFFVTFGRVPLLFYVLHVLLANLGGGLYFYLRYDQARWGPAIVTATPEGYEWSLIPTYLGWALIVLLLYPICRWFAGLKSRSRARWLSYL